MGNLSGSEEFSLKLVKWEGEKGPPINLAWGPDGLIRSLHDKGLRVIIRANLVIRHNLLKLVTQNFIS